MMNHKFWIIILSVCAIVAVVVSQNRPDLRAITKSWIDECGTLAGGANTACFKKAVSQTLGRFGVDTTLGGIAELYDEDPAFGAYCHDFMHLIGREAYNEFRKKQQLHVSPKTAYCAFGFYHGFMETLLSSGGSLSEARTLCALVEQQLGNEAPNAVNACYHGVGHGSVDSHNPQLSGNERALIVPALAVCRKIAQTREELKMCGTGVFDSLSLEYYNQENGFVMRANDPLWMCREQEDVFKEACYMDMMPAMLWMGNYDLAKAAPLVASFSEVDYRALAVHDVANASIRYILRKKDPVVYLEVCRKLSSDLRLPCIAGLGAGVMQFARLDWEYEEGLAFCARPEMKADEKDACFASVLSYVQGRYSSQKAASICQGASPEYQKYCKGEKI